MTEKVFKKGEVIFRQGEQESGFYQVLSGCVGIFLDYGQEQELKLTEVTENQFFGEMAVIESYPRSATAVSLSDDTKVLEVAGDEVRDFLSQNPDNILALMRHLGDRLQDLTKDYNDVTEVINEMKACEKKDRSESLIKRIKKYVAAYKGQTHLPGAQSVEHFDVNRDENHTVTWAEKIRTYPAGTVICKEGETIHCMYHIHQGSVVIYTDYGMDNEQKIAELYTNAFFGEAGMLRDEPRSATVAALEETTVEIIYRDDLQDMFQENPAKVGMIMENLSYRLRYLTNQYREACALVYEAAEDEEKNETMSPYMAEKIKNFKSRLYA